MPLGKIVLIWKKYIKTGIANHSRVFKKELQNYKLERPVHEHSTKSISKKPFPARFLETYNYHIYKFIRLEVSQSTQNFHVPFMGVFSSALVSKKQLLLWTGWNVALGQCMYI